jgi:hypothetical protein
MISGKSIGFLAEQRVGLGVSIALHLLILIFILRSPVLTVPEQTAIDVTFEVPQTSTPKKQIVSPPQVKSLTPPENTDRISEVDATAIKEQVKRGTEGGLPGEPAQPIPPSPQQKQPQSKTQAEPQQKALESKSPPQQQPAPPKPPKSGELHLKDLRLDDATLAMKFGSTPKKAPSAPSASSPTQDLSDYAAFSRPPGSGATFVGSGGVSDHLPNLPDGDITLLNAKANTYAGFVRRVAVQVFAQLRSQGWEKLSMNEVRRIADFTTIEAVLSPDGRFMTMHLIEGSGSASFDSVVKLSVSTGTRDPNPPAGARASDGNIHFIFKARSWSAVGMGRSGNPSEQRWLLLATGLE